MAEHVYKKVEVTGASRNSVEEAVQKAVAKVGKTEPQMRWFEITEIRGAIVDQAVEEWQVTVKIGATIGE